MMHHTRHPQITMAHDIMRGHAFNMNMLKPNNHTMEHLTPAAVIWGFDDNGQLRKPAQRIGHGIANQVDKFERMSVKTEQRQCTPPFQTYGGKYLLRLRLLDMN